MIRKICVAIISMIVFLPGQQQLMAQSEPDNSTGSTLVFRSLTEVLEYNASQSITLQNNEVKMDQAKKAKLAAALGTIDVTGTLLSAQYTDNTTLGVSLFPAEIFGGEPGTFEEVQMGVRYNTNLTNYADIKLVNPSGWSNLKLSKINIDLTDSNNQLSLKSLQENIAANYYNIITLQEQLASSRQNLIVADSLLQMTQHKFREGLVNQQDVNESEINYLNTQESISQLSYLIEQYYISLKILCDIPEAAEIEVSQGPTESSILAAPVVLLSEAYLNNATLKEAYARTNYNGAKAALLPTLSLQLSNSNNLYNTEFQPLTGNWINSNYIGVNLNIPIPNSQRISQKYNAQFEYQMAQNNTRQAKIQADLDQQSLENDHKKALSQVKTDKKILNLREDSFQKNQELYREGIIGLEVVLNSFNAMVNAQYNLIASEVEVQLVLSKIDIHNNIK